MENYSVLMSLYHKEKADHFAIALNSILNQTVRPDEIIIVEDGPLTEQLYAVIADAKQNHPGLITSVVNETNMGLGVALQKGVLASRNGIIARMDTDDIAVPERCALQLAYLHSHENVSIVGGQIEEFVDDPENVVGKRVVPLSDKALKCFIKKRCPFNHMTVMFRKTDILEAGNYQDWFWNEDYYLWIRLALADKVFANLPDLLVKVRVGADMYQRRGGKAYFESEKKIQELMLEKNLIGYPRYLVNVGVRVIIQLLVPNWVRGILFRVFARK